MDWKTGERAPAGALVRVQHPAFCSLQPLVRRAGRFARGVEYILLGILIFFAVIELIALIIGTRMTSTVTGAVAQLYDATTMSIAATSATAFR